MSFQNLIDYFTSEDILRTVFIHTVKVNGVQNHKWSAAGSKYIWRWKPRKEFAFKHFRLHYPVGFCL